jgi:hypothetical protein
LDSEPHLPDNSDVPGDVNWFTRLGGKPNPGQPTPPPQNANSKPARYLGQTIADQLRVAISDPSAPAVPFVPTDEPNFSGGLLGRLAAMACVDPRNPTWLAPPPLDEQLRRFYSDDPVQPWLVQRQRQAWIGLSRESASARCGLPRVA